MTTCRFSFYCKIMLCSLRLSSAILFVALLGAVQARVSPRSEFGYYPFANFHITCFSFRHHTVAASAVRKLLQKLFCDADAGKLRWQLICGCCYLRCYYYRCLISLFNCFFCSSCSIFFFLIGHLSSGTTYLIFSLFQVNCLLFSFFSAMFRNKK